MVEVVGGGEPAVPVEAWLVAAAVVVLATIAYGRGTTNSLSFAIRFQST